VLNLKHLQNTANECRKNVLWQAVVHGTNRAEDNKNTYDKPIIDFLIYAYFKYISWFKKNNFNQK